MILYLFLFFLCTAAHEFTVCKPDPIINISQINFTPDPPISGQNLNIEIIGHPLQEIMCNIDTKFKLYLGSIPIYNTEVDICDFVSAPIEPYVPFLLSYNQTIPSFIPTCLKLKGHLDSVTQGQDNILCIEFNLDISRSSESIFLR